MNSGGFVRVRRHLAAGLVGLAGLVVLALAVAGCGGSSDGGGDGLVDALGETPQNAATLRAFGYADESAIDEVSGGKPDSARFEALGSYATRPASGGGPSLRDNQAYVELAGCLGPDVVAARFSQPAAGSPSQAAVLAVGVRAEGGRNPTEVWCTAVKPGVDPQALAGRLFERLAGQRQDGRLWRDSIGEPDVEVYGKLGVIRVTAAPPDPKTAVFGQFLVPLETGELDALTRS